MGCDDDGKKEKKKKREYKYPFKETYIYGDFKDIEYPNFMYNCVEDGYLFKYAKNYKVIPNVIQTLKELKAVHSSTTITIEKANILFQRLRQNSPAWMEIRKWKILINGVERQVIGSSSIGNQVGCFTSYTLDKMGKNVDMANNEQFVAMSNRKKYDKPFDAFAMTRIEWGSAHEDTAMANLCWHFKDDPEYEFHECGSYLIHPYETCPYVILCSPDGCVYKNGKRLATIEIKCPSPWNLNNNGKTFGHFPHDLRETLHAYYRLQVEVQTRVLQVNEIWHPCFDVYRGTTLMKYERDDFLWEFYIEYLKTMNRVFWTPQKINTEIPPFEKVEEFDFNYDGFIEYMMDVSSESSRIGLSYFPPVREIVSSSYKYPFFDDENHEDNRQCGRGGYSGTSQEILPKMERKIGKRELKELALIEENKLKKSKSSSDEDVPDFLPIDSKQMKNFFVIKKDEIIEIDEEIKKDVVQVNHNVDELYDLED